MQFLNDQGETMFVKFRYSNFRLHWMEHMSARRAVLCHILSANIKYHSIAVCNPSDRFLRDKGRKLALERAMGRQPDGRYDDRFTRNERCRAWAAYHAESRVSKKLGISGNGQKPAPTPKPAEIVWRDPASKVVIV